MKKSLRLHRIMLLIALIMGGFAFGQGGAKGEYVVGTSTFAASDVPVYLWYGYSYTQTIYLQSELNFAGQMIEQIGYQYAGTNSNLEVDIEVWLSHTSQSTITSTVQLAGSTKVYDGPWTLSAGSPWSMISISPFVYNNTDNLLLTIIEKRSGWNSSNDKFYATSSTNMSVGNQDDYTPFNPNSLPTSYARFYRANTKFVTSDIPAGPAISQITPTALAFGQTGVGIGKTLSVQIQNTGSDPLEITGATSSNSHFSLVNTTFPFTLGASGVKVVEIQFLPIDVTTETGTIEFLFDAGIAGDRQVQVSGIGLIIMDVVIGTGTFESHNTPVYPYYGYSFTQTLYLQPELNFQDKQIHRIGYQYIGTTNNLEFTIEVWMAHTSANELTSTQQLGGFTKVYDGPWFVSPGGFSEIDIDPFFYNNTDNLIVTVIEKKPGWNTPTDRFYGTLSGTQNLCRGLWNDNTPYNPQNLPTTNGIVWRPNTKFWFQNIPEGPAVSQITPTTLNFGELDFGQTATLPVVIKNVGVDPLEITGYSSTNSNFSLVGAAFPLTLGYNQQQIIDVLFQPTSIGAESGTITFLMDPAIDGSKQVAVSGQMAELTITDFPWLEGFDSGMPVGWQNETIAGNGWGFFTNPFTHTVIYNFPGFPHIAANLVTPKLDLTGLNNPRLGMNNMFYYYQSSLPISAELLVSTDGANWETLHDLTVLVNNNNYNYEEFDLSAYAGQQIYLAFSVDFPENNSDYYEVVWEIDHVTIYNFIPTFDVTFNVTDPDGNPLTGAVITFGGTTNAQGDYVFEDYPAGTYSYTVQHPGYVKGVGQVTIVNQDVTVNVALSEPGLITQFPWVESFDDAVLPEGWQNESIAGRAWTFHSNPHTHTLNYSLFNSTHVISNLITPMIDLSGQMEVTFGIQHRFYYYQSSTPIMAEIRVSTDGNNWTTLADLSTRVGDSNYYDEYDLTSYAGQMIFLSFSLDLPLNNSMPNIYELVWEIDYVTVFTTPEAFYNVSFNIEDADGNMLNDAVITFDGVTNPAGSYLFEGFSPGTYDYMVELDGYITATGQVNVVDQDVVETVVLTQPVIITEFPWFEGFDGGALPDGWQNVVNQGNEWFFALSPYSHTYNYAFGDTPKNAMLVTPLLDLSDLETAMLGIFHRIYAYETGWSHKILMSPDGTNWQPLAEFNEGFEPDVNMYMEFEIPQQAKALGQIYLAFAIDYPSVPYYYEVVWEIVDVQVFEPIPTYNVNFVVEDENGNPLNNAVVTFDGISKPAGQYLFEEIEAGTYNYSVALDGYLAATGEVTVVDEDVVETVILEEIGQIVELAEGWSLISSYIIAENPSLESIFAKQLQKQNMVIALATNGIFWPGFNINTIGNFNNYEGYKVKMTEDDFVNIQGEMMENTTINLPAGVSYLPVLSDEPVFIEDLFGTKISSLHFAFDLSNQFIYWQDGNITTLNWLLPGKAYLVKMYQPESVSFVNNSKSSPGIAEYQVVAMPWDVQKTDKVHLITIQNNGLSQGDFIGAFDAQGVCVGAVQVNANLSHLGMTIYGDDFTTSEKDGLAEGETIHFRYFDAFANEISDIVPEWDLNMPNTGNFAELGLSGITDFKFAPTGLNGKDGLRVNIYPNPARDILHISMSQSTNAAIEIINNIGQIVMHQTVSGDSQSINISNLSTGIYQVRIIAGNQINYTKIIIQ